MGDSSESPDNPSHPDKPAPACFTPRISEGMAQFLVNTIAGTAKMVQAAVEAHKSAQLACFQAEKSLVQAQLSYIAARGLCEKLVGLLSLPDYQGLFQHMPHPPMPYSEFCTIIRRTESALLHPILEWKPGSPGRRDLSPGSECSCPPETSEDSFLGGIHELRSFRSPGVSETQDEDVTDEEESRSLPIRGRNPSRHKQVETVLLEDQMGGTYVTQRRRSPRRSPSAGMEGISPLVSEQDLSTIQPLICCPSRQGGPGKFLSKVTRRKDQSRRENSDSDTDPLENLAKDTV